MKTNIPSSDILAKATKDARKDGVFAGMSSGLTSAVLGSKIMGFNRNKTIFCGVLTGILSGYFFYKAFLSSNLARLDAAQSSTTLGGSSTPETSRGDASSSHS